MKHFLQNHLRLMILVIAPIFLSACGDFPIGGCSTVFVPSVVLTVSDTNQQPLYEYAVSYRINDGEIRNIFCKSENPCSLAGETRGEFAVTVSKEGFESTSFNVTVGGNYCHVNTETVAVKLKPLF